MELRDYIGIIGKRIWLFIIVIVIVTLGSYFFTVRQPITYDASTYINVMVKPTVGEKVDYDYNNYYSLQSGTMFADVVALWLKDPSNVVDIYDQAQLATPTLEIKKLSKAIDARKKEPAAVSVLINQKEKNAAEKLAGATIDFVKNKTEKLLKEGSIKDINLDISSILLAERKPAVLLNTVIGFVVGLILGLALVFLVEYFRKEK